MGTPRALVREDPRIAGVATVAALRLLDGNQLQGQVEVFGRASQGDGLAATYYWDGSSALADDGELVIRPSSNPATGRWRRFMGLVAGIRFSAYAGVAKTVGAAQTKLDNINTVIYDPTNVYDETLTRFVAPVEGLYNLSLSVNWATGTQINIFLFKNGLNYRKLAFPPYQFATSVQVEAVAGDYFELYVFPLATITVLAGASDTTFMGYYVGPSA